ncbi:amino acid permease/ SLC12A domain-containing protein [Xylaria bambusicola]|uniref:amino acid permease/ SLC12A domain-containing protein n=1 Tax=Xylaria bambusicola TaxID=326684 RepID=UPI0020079072|nr:amino acid permease/ SLC12A domain-containing protein [Xylaria bambusicola]KAI0514627.1 amino acid permease/ SLC12A domain-containing protein [Xylaria bambusicola]
MSTLGPELSRNPSHPPMRVVRPPEGPQYTYDIPGDNKSRVRRDLTPFQVFMITLNATLGVGLYWRAGQILELAGPVAVLVSFSAITLLAWAVMQCISEMLGRWPIPGALSVFVSNFVDYELGIAVGIMYWLTYSVSFAALIATTAGEIRFWIGKEAFDVIIIYITIPLVLILLNCFSVKYYGWIEACFGIIKIIFLFTIIIAMIVLASLPSSHDVTVYNWDNTTAFDANTSSTRGPAFLTAISTAIFAFVGVEIVAACALEAKPHIPNITANANTEPERTARTTVMSSQTKFSLVYFSLIVGAAYTVSGVLTTFSVRRDACGLPRLSWLNSECSGSSENIKATSVFVLAAELANLTELANAFNFFLVFTALSSAQTNLYVASRALFGLATQLRKSEDRFLNYLSWFGETNHRGVPIRAVTLSALAFIWVPFLQLQGYRQNTQKQTSMLASVGISSFIDILSELASVGVIIVWASQCVAFLSYYHHLKKNDEYLRSDSLNYINRKDHTKYPFRSHFQPILGYLAFTGCLFILIVLDSASLYNGFYVEPFLSHFLAVFLFAVLWILLKVYRRRYRSMYFFDVKLAGDGFDETLRRLSELSKQ